MVGQDSRVPADGTDTEQKVASRAEAIAAIQDPMVQRMVRLSVHVRGYAPYYVATLALFAFLAFGPRPDAKGDGTAFGANQTSAQAAAAARGTGAGATSSLAPGPVPPAVADALVAGATGANAFDGLLADAAVGAALSGDTTASAIPEAPAAAPDVPDFDAGDFGGGDFDYGTDEPTTCTIALPSPAPAVSPSREAEGLQRTAEATAGTEAPVDAAPYAEDAATTAGCPSVSGDTPNIPLPVGLPV